MVSNHGRPYAVCFQNNKIKVLHKGIPHHTTIVNIKNHQHLSAFTPAEIDRIIEMAWEDRTPFDAIEYQFGINENQVRTIMRNNLKRSSFELWRKRVHSGVSQKHVAKRNDDIMRFKCSRQKNISLNKIAKR
ncbi:MAG: TIGR03643 family protein [Saprospiraceae bacterium]|nr:TIGR03643 family protein [Saprospiraceae bacterium]